MTNAIVTCSEHFTDFALNELRRQILHINLIEQVSPQHLLLQASIPFSKLCRSWHNQLPIYLHHLFPVQRTFSLAGSAADFVCLRQEAQALSQGHFVAQAQVMGAYPYSTTTIEQALVPGQRSTDVKPAQRILSLLVMDHRCFMGISTADQNLSAFAGGRPVFDEPVPNRAGLKLLEALSAFQIRLRPNNHVLDLGAAPGAWTEILRRRGLRVTAVAPTPMYDWLQTDPQVRCFAMTAEEYLGQCDTTYDLLLNDMKLDPQDSARLMVQYAPYLRAEGIAIMTLKLRLRNPRRVMDHAFRLLRKTYKIIRVRQLVSNRKEVTLFLRRK